jgi:hypothetical protein
MSECEYEYLIVKRHGEAIVKLQADFNLRGLDGWQLVALDRDNFYFIRLR